MDKHGELSGFVWVGELLDELKQAGGLSQLAPATQPSSVASNFGESLIWNRLRAKAQHRFIVEY